MKIESQNGIKPVTKVEIKDGEKAEIEKLPYVIKPVYLVCFKRYTEKTKKRKRFVIAAFYSEEEAKKVASEIEEAREKGMDYKPSGKSVWTGEKTELKPAYFHKKEED